MYTSPKLFVLQPKEEGAKPMRVISVLNFKGGIGKTSLSINLADAIREQGKTCLIIDADRQSNTTTTLLGARQETGLHDFYTNSKLTLAEVIYEAREKLYVVPSDTNLDHVSTFLSNQPRAYYRMREGIKSLEGQGIDYIFIDHAGAFSKLMGSLLESSYEMLIPCVLEPFSIFGLKDLFDKLDAELEGYSIKVSGIIPYNTDFSKSLTSAYLEKIKEDYGEHVINQIRTDTAVMYSQTQGKTVLEYEKANKIRSRAAHDFRELAQVIINQEVLV